MSISAYNHSEFQIELDILSLKSILADTIMGEQYAKYHLEWGSNDSISSGRITLKRFTAYRLTVSTVRGDYE